MQSLTPHAAALQQLSAVPGIIGSLVFAATGEIRASLFPPVFDAAGLNRLATQLAGDAFFPQWVAGEEGALELRYGDGTVLVRAVDDAWLLVLCTTQANPQLLSMSLTQLVRRLRTLPPPPPAPAKAREASALERLRAVVQGELGEHAPQALEILAAAGERPKDLRRAADEVEKLTKLFISTKKAGEIARKMRDVLGG